MTPIETAGASRRSVGTHEPKVEVPSLEGVRSFLHAQLVAQGTLRNLSLRRAWVDPVQGLRLLYQGWNADDSAAILCAAETLDPSVGFKEAERLNRQFRERAADPSRPRAQAAAYSPDLGLIFTMFPIDRHLTSLSRAIDPRLMKPVLETRLDQAALPHRLSQIAIGPVQYKPGRKCMLEYRLEWETPTDRRELPPLVYGRVSRHARRAYTTLQALREASSEHAFRFPQPVALIEDLELELIGHVPGRPLSRLCHDPDFPRWCGATGEGLAEFHRAPVVLERRASEPLDPARIEQYAARLAEELPQDGPRIRSVAQAISRRFAGADGLLSPVHGDFHPGNILVDESRLGLLDFEACGMGQPESDVGFFCAELTLLSLKEFGETGALDAGLRAFIKAYRRTATGAYIGDLGAYAAAACLWCADYQCLRRPEAAGWRERAQAMVEAAGRLAQGDPTGC